MSKPDIGDLLSTYGKFAVYDPEMGGKVVNDYTLDGLDYVQVVFGNSPKSVYTYLKGE